MPQIWRALEPWVAFEVRATATTVEGHYAIQWQDELAYRVSQGSIDLESIAIQPAEGYQPTPA